MNTGIVLILIIPLLVAIAAITLLRTNLLGRFSKPATATPSTPATRAVVAVDQELPPNMPLPQTPPSRVMSLAVAAILTLAVFVMVLLRITASSASDDVVVLVAPFQEADGSFTQTGRVAADLLVERLPQATDGRVRAERLDSLPADEQALRTLMADRDADVVVWGTINTGGLLDDMTIVPTIAYQPTGAYAPALWQGYTGRFALPLQYRISSTPINAAVVLPQLLAALADYAADKPDSTERLLRKLLVEYPTLHPVLPNMILGNLQWARGEIPAAAASYRLAIQAADTTGSMPQAALLYNNVGAIYQDGGDIASREAFNQAIGLLNSVPTDLGELRYNLALAAVQVGDLAAAQASIDTARRLLPASTVLLLDWSEILRVNGLIRDPNQDSETTGDDALSVLARVERQIARDIDSVPSSSRELHSNALRAQYIREDSIARLTRLIDLNGSLLWGLEVRTDLNPQTLGQVRTALKDAIDREESRTRGWKVRAAAEDAASHGLAGQIAAHQGRLAEQSLRESQRWHAIVIAELGEAQLFEPDQGLAGFWSRLNGGNALLAESQRDLEALVALNPRDVELLILLGHTQIARNELSQATAQFNTADTLAPSRPEPLYGLALVRLADQNGTVEQRRADARALLNQSIERNPSFYPARMQLAILAEEEGDWETALTQRRRLAQEQPNDSTILELAHSLYQSGRPGYTEAEALLLPLANRNNVTALVQLSALYRELEDIDAQRQVLERAQRIASRNVQIAYDLGTIAANANDPTEAERQFRIALATDRRHVPSLLAMAQLNIDTSTIAADYYRQALDAGADDIDALKAIGSAMALASQNQLALQAYERAAQLASEDAEIAHLLAQANLRMERFNQAQQAAQRALDLRGGVYPEAHADLGDIALARDQPVQAREFYNSALRANPNLVTAQIGLGRAIAAQGDWSVAVGYFRTAVELSPNMPEARLWLAEALIRQDTPNPRAALAEYQQALAERPEYPEALFGAGQAYIALGQLTEAEVNLDAAIALQPEYAEAFLLRGKLYEQTNRDRKALTAYEQAIAANTQLAEPHYRRALLLIQNNRLNDARGNLEAALRSQPVFPEASYWLGRIEFAQADYAAAIKRFQAAVAQAAGNYPEARFYQGLTEEQLGQRDAAIQSFRATLNQNTAGSWAGEARAALNRLGVQ